MNAPSLTGFLTMTGAKYRLFDLGVHLRAIPKETLAHLDEGRKYPYPHLGYAWIAFFVWQEDPIRKNNLWFVKLPLDEQGVLITAVHNDLVRRLYLALQTTDEKERHRLLTDHPYQFKPPTQMMAALHATASLHLQQPPSQYFDQAADYFLTQSPEVSWHQIGVQGVADLVVRCSKNHCDALVAAIKTINEKAFIELATALEHVEIPEELMTSILDRAQTSGLSQTAITAAVRACAQGKDKTRLETLITEKLSADDSDLEFILTVLTRYPYLCQNTSFAVTALTRLAEQADHDGFKRVLTNLAMQPELTGITMEVLGSPTLTPTLANALSQLIQSQRSPDVRH